MANSDLELLLEEYEADAHALRRQIESRQHHGPDLLRLQRRLAHVEERLLKFLERPS